MSTSGIIYLRLLTQGSGALYLGDVPDISALQTFASFIDGYTSAAVWKYEFIDTRLHSGTEEGTDVAAMNHYAQIKLRRPTDNKRMFFQLPAPINHFSYDDTRKRYTYSETEGQAIAAAYSTLIGETWEFVEGYLIGRGTDY